MRSRAWQRRIVVEIKTLRQHCPQYYQSHGQCFHSELFSSPQINQIKLECPNAHGKCHYFIKWSTIFRKDQYNSHGNIGVDFVSTYYNIYQFLKSGNNSLFRKQLQKWGKRKDRPPSEVRKWWSWFVSPTNQEGLDWQSRLWEIKIRFGYCVMVIVVEQMTIMVLVITWWMVLINEYFWDDKNPPRIVDDCLYGWSGEKIN